MAELDPNSLPPPSALDGRSVQAITFDFGNTLVLFDDASLRATLDGCAARVERRLPWVRAGAFVRVWREERDRQIREDVPEGREMDMDVRVLRVLARLRGASVPRDGQRWDDTDALGRSEPAELRACLEAYMDAFLEATPVPPGVGPMLERLARRHRLAILSNWPLTAALDRFVDEAGWRPHLSAVVVSHSVGCIKPHRPIFDAAARALGLDPGPAILHVGDDLGADVGGAHAAGWRAAWVASRPHDSPLPSAELAGDVAPDLVLPNVLALEAALG